MIHIENKQYCVGCNACAQICPKQCISMHEDHEGFIYPKVDTTECIDCNRCEKACPVIYSDKARTPLTVYAVKSRDEVIRKESSSGGVFTLLAEQTIQQQGVVFGAGFNADWEVVHSYTETLEGLQKFRGSKYVQSLVGESFKQVSQFLKEGREVLFSGTPCQVAGLKKYLNKAYSNLLTVDIVCHGVPSPKVFRLYLDEVITQVGFVKKETVLSANLNRELIQDIQFRNKTHGWKRFSFLLSLTKGVAEEKKSILFSETIKKNAFLRGFRKNLYLRPSCYACPSKNFKSGSDITLGDFWGVENYYPEFDDDKGTSIVLTHSVLGEACYAAIATSTHSIPIAYASAFAGNSCMEHAIKEHPNRAQFFRLYRAGKVLRTIQNTTNSLFKRQLIPVVNLYSKVIRTYINYKTNKR